jgi:hypothetical protein
MELYDNTDVVFKRLLKEELIGFKANNSTTVERITSFLETNTQLVSDINLTQTSETKSIYV